MLDAEQIAQWEVAERKATIVDLTVQHGVSLAPSYGFSGIGPDRGAFLGTFTRVMWGQIEVRVERPRLEGMRAAMEFQKTDAGRAHLAAIRAWMEANPE